MEEVDNRNLARKVLKSEWELENGGRDLQVITGKIKGGAINVFLDLVGQV